MCNLIYHERGHQHPESFDNDRTQFQEISANNLTVPLCSLTTKEGTSTMKPLTTTRHTSGNVNKNLQCTAWLFRQEQNMSTLLRRMLLHDPRCTFTPIHLTPYSDVQISSFHVSSAFVPCTPICSVNVRNHAASQSTPVPISQTVCMLQGVKPSE